MKKIVKIYFRLFYEKKQKTVPMANKPEGGGLGKALMARPLREELFFCGFSNYLSQSTHYRKISILFRKGNVALALNIA